MRLFLKRVHHYYYIGSVVFFFILLYPFLYYYSRKPERYFRLNRFRKLLSKLSSSFAGIFFNFSFEERIDWSKPYIICPNHTSNLDIAAAVAIVKGNYAFLGKDDLLENPVTGLFFKTIDIPLNRDSKISAFRAFKRAEEYLKQGIHVFIFPEGMISNDYPPKLHPFKNGPFRLAIEQKISILPVSMCNVWKIMWDDGAKYGSKPGTCHIHVHKPISTLNLTIEDADNLRDQVHAIIDEKLRQYETGS